MLTAPDYIPTEDRAQWLREATDIIETLGRGETVSQVITFDGKPMVKAAVYTRPYEKNRTEILVQVEDVAEPLSLAHESVLRYVGRLESLFGDDQLIRVRYPDIMESVVQEQEYAD